MTAVNRRWLLSTGLVLLGVICGAIVFYVGWQLPHRQECSGDTCETTLAIDWARVDWSIPPERYACGVPHPDEGNPLIGPGDVCVTATGAGTVLERVTYEELRTRAARRRMLTLAAIGLIALLTVIATVRAGRRGSSAT